MGHSDCPNRNSGSYHGSSGARVAFMQAEGVKMSTCTLMFLYVVGGLPQVEMIHVGETTEKECIDVSHLSATALEDSKFPYKIEQRMIWGQSYEM